MLFEPVEIEGVHRLTEFEHYEICYIDDVAYPADTAERKVSSHPCGAFLELDIVYDMTDIPRADIGSLDLYVNDFSRVAGNGVVGGGHLHLLAEYSRHLACHTEYGLAVRAVRGNGDIEDVIVETHDLADIVARDGILWEIEQSVYFGAGEEVVV